MMGAADLIQLGVFLAALGALWLQIRQNGQALQKNLETSMHSIDKRIHGVEIIVGPYASQMKKLEEKQTDNMSKIAKLEARLNDIDRLQRELDSLRTQINRR